MSRLTRFIGLLILTGTATSALQAAHAADSQTFQAPDDSYSFDYPDGYIADHEFADGTGDVTGVKASSMTNGDVVITFFKTPGTTLPPVSEQTRPAYLDAYVKGVAVLPSITFKSSGLTTMLGQPALDMVFEKKIMGKPVVNRYVSTVVNGSEYNFLCVYSAEKAAEFAPGCDLAVSTAKLTDASAAPAPKNAECTKLEFNRRAMVVSERTSEMLMTDQSRAMIERVKKAHDAAMAIDERVGDTPAGQDCKDIDAILETLN